MAWISALLLTCGGGALGVLRLGFRSRGGLAFCD
jgi:hypothetical protein